MSDSARNRDIAPAKSMINEADGNKILAAIK